MSNGQLAQCHACKGYKTFLGMGGITKDCPTCKGIGFITIDYNESPIPIAPKELSIRESITANIGKKKRGRKPKSTFILWLNYF